MPAVLTATNAVAQALVDRTSDDLRQLLTAGIAWAEDRAMDDSYARPHPQGACRITDFWA